MIRPEIDILFYIDQGLKKNQKITYYLFDLIG
ncbi:MAG: hypothetical protein FD166_1908 [Bacteroidetes bacterium]|nr:MAG: hypothetical protein FD166_1908 [Bacteroidota bacterium]